MIYLRIFVILLIVCTISCSTTSNKNGMTSFNAIQLAAKYASQGIKGKFNLKVRATGRQNQNIYLNSQSDYRDQRNISIVIPPVIAVKFKQLYGVDSDVHLKGKNIIVSGVAKRVKIWFFCNGNKTDKYYYQTHVVVTTTNQIKII